MTKSFFFLQLILSLDSLTGAPLSPVEWSLLNAQTSNCPAKFGAIMFIPCLLGVLPPTTATVFHHGSVNDARATRVQVLSPPKGSSSPSRASAGKTLCMRFSYYAFVAFALNLFLRLCVGCCHICPGLGPLPINLSPAPSDDFYITRAVVAVAAKQVR